MPPPCLLTATSINWNRLNLPAWKFVLMEFREKGHFALAFAGDLPVLREGGIHAMGTKTIRSRHMGKEGEVGIPGMIDSEEGNMDWLIIWEKGNWHQEDQCTF